MNELGKILVVIGLLIASAERCCGPARGAAAPAGALARDIHYSRGNFSFYFPLMTCVLLKHLRHPHSWPAQILEISLIVFLRAPLRPLREACFFVFRRHLHISR